MTEHTEVERHPKKPRGGARPGPESIGAPGPATGPAPPPTGAIPSADPPEIAQLKATIAVIRGELERAGAERELAVRRAVEAAGVEIGQLRSTVVTLRADLERAVVGAEAGAREASAASDAVIAQLQESVGALRGLLEGLELRRGEEVRALELRHLDESRELHGIIVALRQQLERAHAGQE